MKTIKFIFLLFISNLLAEAQIPSNGLVVHYPFSGNANDNSGNLNTATVNGALLTTDRFGNANSAYYFNGSSSIVANNSSNFNSETWSISVWYNTTNTGTVQRLTNKGGPSTNTTNYLCILMDATGRIYGTLWNGSAELQCKDAASTNDGNWHHVVYIRDVAQSKHYLYVDGILKTTSNDTYTTLANTSSFTIGKNGPPNQFWTGKIDDIRIYNRALPLSEITPLFNESICYQSVNVTDVLTIKSGIATGLNSLPSNFGTVQIYPNPAVTSLTVSVSTPNPNYTIKFYNPQGSEVYSSLLNSASLQVDLTSFSTSGLYLIKILDNSSNVLETKKLILQ